VLPGALLKFKAPGNYYFNTLDNNSLTLNSSQFGVQKYLYSKVVSVAGDGTNGGTGILTSGFGTIKLNDIIPNTAELVRIIAPFKTKCH
jgi:hypothetical protein